MTCVAHASDLAPTLDPAISSEPVRVAVLDDYEVVTAGVAAVLDDYPTRVRVVELDSCRPVVSAADVALYDTFAQVQGANIDVTKWLTDDRTKFVVFSWNLQPDVIRGALEAGASGYICKRVSGSTLVDLLERVHRGEQVSPLELPMPAAGVGGRWPGDELGISPRESEVLALICQGLNNQEIADQVFLSMNTIKTHVRLLYKKIGAESRTQALLWGIDHGFRPDTSRTIVTSGP